MVVIENAEDHVIENEDRVLDLAIVNVVVVVNVLLIQKLKKYKEKNVVETDVIVIGMTVMTVMKETEIVNVDVRDRMNVMIVIVLSVNVINGIVIVEIEKNVMNESLMKILKKSVLKKSPWMVSMPLQY